MGHLGFAAGSFFRFTALTAKSGQGQRLPRTDEKPCLAPTLIACYKRSMQPLIHNSAPQARNWSAQLGTLAAENALALREVPPRFATILHYLRQRGRVLQDLDAKFRANQFLVD